MKCLIIVGVGLLLLAACARAAFNARIAAQTTAARQRRAEFLGMMGLGLMQLGQPRTLGPAPRAPITCTQQGKFTTCY